MVRTLAVAGLVTLFGVSASQAQYQDSAPPEEQYDTESPYDDSYDFELLGDPEENGFSEPDIDVGIFATLGHDGRWFFAADFGWVWRPYVATTWRPYSDGHWVWTSYGWTWVSYEPFGWATYHYGYWVTDARLGWVWIPGYDWSACRVQFAYYGDYISWAPLGPPGYYCPRPWTTAGFSVWFTVGANNFCDPYPYRYCVQPYYNSDYRDRVKFKSPDRRYVEQYSGRSIRTETVNFKYKTSSRGEAKQLTSRGTGVERFTATKSRSFNTARRDVRVERAPRVERAARDVTSRAWHTPSKSGRVERRAVQPKRDTRETRNMARAERSSKPLFNKSEPAREQRSIQHPREAQRSKALHAQRSSSGERKTAMRESSPRQERRTVAKSKSSRSSYERSSGQYGKAKR